MPTRIDTSAPKPPPPNPNPNPRRPPCGWAQAVDTAKTTVAAATNFKQLTVLMTIAPMISGSVTEHHPAAHRRDRALPRLNRNSHVRRKDCCVQLPENLASSNPSV